MTLRFDTHNHSEYSNLRNLDCINKVEDLVKRAIEIGLAGIALTDHETLAAHIKANKLAKEYPDFKIALGNEIYLVDERPCDEHWHFILIAKDALGHRQLRQLSSIAWMNSYSRKGIERVDTLKADLENIVIAAPGHLVATTACLGGEFSKSILEMELARKKDDAETANFYKQKIINFVLWCKKLFGEDFYFECAPAANKEQIIVNKKMTELSNVFGVKMVIGCDSHYLKKSDRFVHKAYLTSHQAEREVDSFYEYSYLQSEEEILENLTPSIVDLYEEMCQNSMEIYNKIENYSLLHAQGIPKVKVFDYPIHHTGDDFHKAYPNLAALYESKDKVDRYWVQTCMAKLDEIGRMEEIYVNRLEEEARVKRIVGSKLGTNMFAYPVTLQHYVNLFWECGSMVGAGRGSSCSGLNHYLLGITQLDPIEWNLPFWRYLNEDRLELGDIDLDLCPSKVGLILNKIKEERGQNFIPEIDDLSRANLGCTRIATFGTETTKSAILTACRGYRSEEYPDGIDNDIGQYLSSLVPVERGFVWSLKDMVVGDENKGRRPVTTFINEVNSYPGLLNIMMGIEGLISRRSSHASGVILFDEDPYEHGCFMKTPSGEIITQYDLHDDEAAGLTKYDFLVTSVQDKLVQAIELLQEDNQLPRNMSLRQIYNEYFHPSVLPIEDDDIWKKIQNVQVLDLFQFDSDVGSQAAKMIRPRSIMELADANGLMRLMTAEKGAETPMEKYVRFKNNINLWYKEMDDYGLTKEEQEILKPYFLKSHGVPPSQEQMMMMLMDKDICHFSLADANAARKIVGKKQMSKIPQLKEQVFAQASSQALAKYIWECGIGTQLGYSFSIIHALAYSFIGFQTAFISTKWNPIYWNTACLIVNSESMEGEDDNRKEESADYEKIAKAIGNITSNHIEVSLVDINHSDYGFKPDVQNNRIIYGLKPLSKINSEIIEKIKTGRPYSGIKDFMMRCPLNKSAMLMLIKSGAFDNCDADLDHNRRKIMIYYIDQICGNKTKLNLQNFKGLIDKKLIPKELELQIRIFNFNKYLKAGRKAGLYYTFDEPCEIFFNKFMTDYLDSLEVINGIQCITQKAWDKIYQNEMNAAREWLKENQNKVLEEYNEILFLEVWNDYCRGSLAKWEMQALCYYHSPHELSNVNNIKYGISNFKQLAAEPEIDYFYKRGKNNIPIYKLHKICGTVLAKNDSRSSITLLTTSGVVSVKFTRDYYAMFKKRISQIKADGKKQVVEESWFKRGTLLMIKGFRRGDQFVAKNYKNSGGHQLYKINEVINGDIIIQHERVSPDGSFEEDEEYNNE